MSPPGMDADVAVVGAGPAGQAMALALAKAGFATLLVDAGEGPAPAPALDTADLRVFALSPASTRLLAALGAWPAPAADRVCGYRRMRVWQHDPDAGLAFDAAALGWPHLGHIVEHGVLQHALASVIASVPELRCHWRCRVEGIEHRRDHVELRLDSGEHLRVRLAVAADGAGSPLRRLAGLAMERVDYGQSGLVANVRCQQAHDHTARQRFLDSGPLAFLPLASGEGDCSIVWSQPTASAQRRRELSAAEFERDLYAASGGALGRIELLGDRAAFPLARQLVPRYFDRRVVLVADAAHVVHPLAGQGLNLGFQDVAALAEVLGAARARAIDPGSDAVLARYARWRQGDNALAARAFEAIDRMFRSGGGIGDAVRGAGMRLMDRLAPVKRRFILHASGLAGRVPAVMARGDHS